LTPRLTLPRASCAVRHPGLLHNQIILNVQQRLQLERMPMVILPMPMP